MCTFITATVNADADPSLVRATLNGLGFRFEDCPPPKGLPPGRRYLAHDSGKCDCGTAVGSGDYGDGAPYDEYDLEKLRRKGWSQARIDRWIGEKVDAAARDERAQVDRLQAARPELARWTRLVRGMLATPGVRVFGLMHDGYASGPGYGDHAVTARPPTSVDTLDEDRLFRLPEGALAEWTR